MKRRLTKLTAFLLLGAIINVAVAWGIVLWSPWGFQLWPNISTSAIPHVSFVEELTDWPRRAPVDWPSPRSQSYLRTSGLSLTLIYGRVPVPSDDTAADTRVQAMMWLFQSGWPCRSLESVRIDERFADGRQEVEMRNVIPLPEALASGTDEGWRHLLYHPTWPGFAINTIFYAAILWLLTLGPFTVRRFIRHTCGHCIKCGYDLRGDFSSGCPECGWQRASET